MIKQKITTRFLAEAAAIAAAYTALTVLLLPLGYGVMQVRVSEALTVLPRFTPAAVPGLFIGCLLANLISPYGLLDLICGSVASLLGALISYRLREKSLLVPLPPVILNGIIIGAMLYFAYGVPMPLPLCMLWVAAGEVLACYVLGYPLMRFLEKRKFFNGKG